MKKVFIVLLVILLVGLLFCGCNSSAVVINSRMKIVENQTDFTIYKDTKTNVLYLSTKSGVTVMYNAGGNVLVEGEKNG